MPTEPSDMTAATVFERLEQLLNGRGVPFDVLRHPPVFTSTEAAQVRGTPLSSGAKALICKADLDYLMIVMPADLRLASRAIRRQLGIRSLRFAEVAEVEHLTSLKPGAIPPFGSLFGLQTYCDHRLAANERINFNAGDHGISISLPYTSYLEVERPQIGEFAE